MATIVISIWLVAAAAAEAEVEAEETRATTAGTAVIARLFCYAGE